MRRGARMRAGLEHTYQVLSSYENLENKTLQAIQAISFDDVPGFMRWFLLDMPVVPILLGFHTLFVADKIHQVTKGCHFWFKVSYSILMLCSSIDFLPQLMRSNELANL